MLDFKTGAMSAMLLVTPPLTPLVAQTQSPPIQNIELRDNSTGEAVSEDKVARTGAALKQVIKITQVYGPRLQAARSADERLKISNEEVSIAKQAITDQGITVEEYEHVMDLADAQPEVRARLVRAANATE